MSQPISTTTADTAAIVKKSVNRQIFSSLLSIASAAFLIRVMGMLNQIVVTAHFGSGALMDAYFVAYTLPFMMGMLAIGIIEAAIVPVYARVCATGTKEQVSALFSTLLNLFLIGAALITLVIVIFRRQAIYLSAPALDPFRMGLAVNLALIVFPIFLLMVMISLLESILNTEGQFGWPAYAGMLVPLSTALLVVLAGKFLGVIALCAGLLIGLSLQLCAFIVRVRRVGLVYRPILDLRSAEIRIVLIALCPALLGAVASQISPLIDQIFASFLSTGSISALNYSLKLASVPIGVIFASVGRAVLPHLSRQVATKNMKVYKETFRLYVLVVGFVTVMLAVFMIVLAHPLVQILFQRGAFSAEDTNLTANTLIGFLIGLPPMALCFILVPAFSALGKTSVLMFIGIFNVIANTAFDYVFVRFWQSTGIALATSAMYFFAMLILFFTLRRKVGKLSLFTIPPEMVEAVKNLGKNHSYAQWISWLKASRSRLTVHSLRDRLVVRLFVVLVVIAIGVVGVSLNAVYMLHAAFGSLIILAFLRYRYMLLIVWVLIAAFIGSGLPIVSGSNFLTGLTIPLLLLMVCMPLRSTFKRMPALAFLLLYLLWMFAGIFISANDLGSFLTLWVTYFDYLALAVLSVNVLTTRRRLMGLIDAILFASLCVALYGISGYVTKHHVVLDPTTRLLRITSVFGAAPTLALFLSISIPLALYRIYTLRGYWRIGGSMVLLILLMAFGLTFTRTAFICLPISIVIMLFSFPSRKAKVGLLIGLPTIAAIALVLALMGHIAIFSRFFNSDLLTFNGRIYLWQALLAHFDPALLQGSGLDAAHVLLVKLQIRDARGVVGIYPHDLFLGTLYDLGIIGVVLLSSIYIRLLTSLIARLRTTDKPERSTSNGAKANELRMLLALALGILVSVLVQSIESDDLWILGIGCYFWIIMALPFACYWFAQSKTGSYQVLNTSRSSKLRICFVSTIFSPGISGVGVRTEKQARQLQALGCGVIIVTLRHNKGWKRAETISGMPVVRIGGVYRRNGQLRNGRLGHLLCDIGVFLALWHMRRRYDIVHVCQMSSLDAVGAFIGNITRKPVVISIQISGPDEKQREQIEHGRMLMAGTLSNPSLLKVTVPGWALAEGDITYLPKAALGGSVMLNYLRNSSAYYHILGTRCRPYLTSQGFRSERIVLIPNGIDTDRFRPAPQRRPDPAGPERDIICVARLDYAKGVDVLLHAWKSMMQAPMAWHSHLKPRLRLVGDGALRTQIERLITALEFQDSVEILGPRTDIIDLLQQSWGFVLPSRWEGMANALLEAMACGLPCIATRVSGSEDVIVDSINGLLVEPEQPAELAQALSRIIEDGDLAQRLGQAGHATIMRDYQLIDVTRQHLELYHRLLKEEENDGAEGHLIGDVPADSPREMVAIKKSLTKLQSPLVSDGKGK
jgi:putative peptidoglycan lipid II flippase